MYKFVLDHLFNLQANFQLRMKAPSSRIPFVLPSAVSHLMLVPDDPPQPALNKHLFVLQ